MRIGAIALNTWRETVRDRLLIAIGLLLVALLSGALLIEGPGHPRVVLDMGLSAMTALGTLVAIFLGTSLVHKELDKRTLYVVLSKPVTRFEFLAGKYLGLLATLTVVVGLMGLGTAITMAVLGQADWHVAPLFASLWVQLALVTAIAFCFSTITSGILAALYTGGLVLVGLQTDLIREFAESEVKLHLSNYLIGKALWYVLPNFGVFDHKNAVLYGGSLPWAAWAWGVVYGLLLSAAFLVVASVAWEDRELR